MELQPCKCIAGDFCIPSPNRFRKATGIPDWYASGIADQQVLDGMAAANAAVKAEFPELCFDWCQNMQPVVAKRKMK